jgi:CheY-like chemotaxis protein
VPALALTAFARDEDSQRALAAGFQRHVAKPVEPAELSAVIAELCQSGVAVVQKPTVTVCRDMPAADGSPNMENVCR